MVRSVVSYCQILGRPIRIFNIRHKRSTPGLAAQHLEGLHLVARISHGRLHNGFVKSTEVTFAPLSPRADVSGQSFQADPGTAGAVTLMLQVILVVPYFFLLQRYRYVAAYLINFITVVVYSFLILI